LTRLVSLPPAGQLAPLLTAYRPSQSGVNWRWG